MNLEIFSGLKSFGFARDIVGYHTLVENINVFYSGLHLLYTGHRDVEYRNNFQMERTKFCQKCKQHIPKPGVNWTPFKYILNISFISYIRLTHFIIALIEAFTWYLFLVCRPGITTATWRCRKMFSQWERSFHWKLCYHWLKGLQQRQIAIEIQDQGWGVLKLRSLISP